MQTRGSVSEDNEGQNVGQAQQHTYSTNLVDLTISTTTDAGGEADGEEEEDSSGTVRPGGLLQTCPLQRGQ